MNIKFKDIHQALNDFLKKDETEIKHKERVRIGYPIQNK